MKPRRQKDGMRADYELDYSRAVRGKYYRQLLKEGANVVVLDPDVAKAFRTSEAVNDALRSLLEASKVARRSTAVPTGRPRARRTTGSR